MSLKLDVTDEKLRDAFYSLESARDIALLLDVKYSKLVYHLYVLKSEDKYKFFEIPKKTGGVRKIATPVTAIKILQQKLNQVLLAVYSAKPQVHSFLPGKSIVSNAKAHSRKQVVLNLDLLDFFPAIHFGRVMGLFMGKPYFRNKEVATTLAQLCALNSGLPQGAPSSPMISNMICGQLDSQLLKYADKNQCYYTRYADDITISTYRPGMPNVVAKMESDGSVKLGSRLEKIIKENGFSINYSKLRMFSKNRRQEVTGLKVNRFPNVRKKMFSQVRAMLHAWKKFGYENAQTHFWEMFDGKHRSEWTQKPSFARVVRGKIEFIGMVRGKSDPRYKKFMTVYSELYSILHPEYIPEVDTAASLAVAFKEMNETDDAHRRGYLFEEFLKRLFEFNSIKMKDPFVRNSGGEQIDGTFNFDGWFYIVEARWRKKAASIREVDGLLGPLGRSGEQTMGVFIHMGGWSKHVVPQLKQNPKKSIFLVSKEDIQTILERVLDLELVLTEKLDALNTRAEPYISVKKIIEKK